MAVSFESPKGIEVSGTTFLPIPSRDHEEQILRDKASKDVALIVGELTKNVYLGREQT